MNLEAIILWKMNPEEAKIFKLCVLWEKIMELELPDYRGTRLPLKSDPRKSLLYRYCRKLYVETKDFFKEDEYRLYILAQVQTLKNFSDGKIHALVEPACLCGPKAWMRWQIWKKKYDKQLRQMNSGLVSVDLNIKANKSDIVNTLEKTKKHFQSVWGDDYTKSDVEKVINSKEMVKWVAFNKVSPYYVVLSPLIKQHFTELEDTFTIQTEFLNKGITPEITEIFRNMFSCEF